MLKMCDNGISKTQTIDENILSCKNKSKRLQVLSR